ncbi:MAG: hypothetical protein K8T90_04175 [Planctomycetes bacterium]|nr:hypothetical protein [Planctomycetota bacterium]
MTRRAWAVVIVGALAVAGAAAWVVGREPPAPRRVFVRVGEHAEATLHSEPDGDEIAGWYGFCQGSVFSLKSDPLAVIVEPRRNPVIAWLADRLNLDRSGTAAEVPFLTVVGKTSTSSGVWFEAVESLTDLLESERRIDPTIAGRWRLQPAGYVQGLSLTLAPDGSLHVDAPEGGARGVRWAASKDRLLLELTDVSDDLSQFVRPGLRRFELDRERKSFATGWGGPKGWREE